MKRFIERMTDAPESYDGFGTITIKIVGTSQLAMAAGNPVRLVHIDEEHDDWQTSRYDSGGYAYTTDQAPAGTWTAIDAWSFGEEE